MTENEKLELMNGIVADALLNGQNVGELLLSNGVEPKATGKWLKDGTYHGLSKEIYICSSCLHWQSVRRSKKEQIAYMKYCPYCGAKMTKEV